MQKLKYLSGIFLFCLLASCQGVPNKNLSPDLNLTPMNSNPVMTTAEPTHQITPIVNSESTIEQPTIIFDNRIDFSSAFGGRLFVGSSDSGVYVELDFENSLTVLHELPKMCQLLLSGQKAVCELGNSSVRPTPYIYDLSASKEKFIFNSDGGRWFLTSSNNLLVYADVNNSTIKMDAYNLETEKTFRIGEFDNREMELAIPYVSNSGKFMIGLNHGVLSWEHDDSWYIMRSDEMVGKPILVPERIAATDSIAWSPDDTIVALIGTHNDEINGDAGTITCGQEVLFYDSIKEFIKLEVTVPDGRCITPFGFYPSQIWSPDSSKLVLVLDQQDICIIDILADNPTCSVVTDYFGTNTYFSGVAWSPDTKYIAFTFEYNQVQIYSIVDAKKYIINIGDLYPSLIGRNVVWVQ